MNREEIPKEYFDEHLGVTDTSNWLIPQRVLMSAYPGDLDEKIAENKMLSLLQCGISTFLCLQTSGELERFAPYKETAIKLNQDHSLQLDLQFLSLEIPDGNVTQDELVISMVEELIVRYERKEKILIHCWGGHGRTGTVAAILYGKITGVNAEEALKHVAKCHKCRKIRKSNAPQRVIQFEQVRRILSTGVPQQ
eukprot:TRINITY_DN5387_c0_g1_i1.p1 TRINITY_DN5387_c0_g1~~TRINITY_DN5387_c0_g1_i1.p1  ORF type:complete len:195 (-),score=50.31 TRINITY_DN5387_c0_g1_i1:187-771(-)